MGFLKSFFTNVYSNESPTRPASRFGQLSDDQLEAHAFAQRDSDGARVALLSLAGACAVASAAPRSGPIPI